MMLKTKLAYDFISTILLFAKMVLLHEPSTWTLWFSVVKLLSFTTLYQKSFQWSLLSHLPLPLASIAHPCFPKFSSAHFMNVFVSYLSVIQRWMILQQVGVAAYMWLIAWGSLVHFQLSLAGKMRLLILEVFFFFLSSLVHLPLSR